MRGINDGVGQKRNTQTIITPATKPSTIAVMGLAIRYIIFDQIFKDTTES